MDSTSSISVVIPTAGQRDLARCLASLEAQRLRPAEVIVAWNAGTPPPGRDAIGRLAGIGPPRFVHEPVAGLNRARNAGCRAARGSIIALLDDDCAADREWLQQIASAFARHPGAGIVCGPVDLEFEIPPPAWLVMPFTAALSHLDWGNQEIELAPGQYVVGANMSFTRDAYRRLGGFADGVGMVGTGQPQLSNDENRFVEKARRSGSPGVLYTPRAVVRHWIARARASIDFLVGRRYGQGYSDAALEDHPDHRWRLCLDLVARARTVFDDILRDKERRLGENDGRIHGTYYLLYETAYLTGVLDRIRNLPPRAAHTSLTTIAKRDGEAAREAMLLLLRMPALADLNHVPGERERQAVFAAIERLYET